MCVMNSIAVVPATSKVRSNEKGCRVALRLVFEVQETALADKSLGEVEDPAQVVGSTVATDDVLGREEVAPLVALVGDVLAARGPGLRGAPREARVLAEVLVGVLADVVVDVTPVLAHAEPRLLLVLVLVIVHVPASPFRHQVLVFP